MRVARAVHVLNQLDARRERLGGHARLVAPGAVQVRNPHIAPANHEMSRVEPLQHYGLFFRVGDFAPRLNHVDVFVGTVVEFHLERIGLVFQGDGRKLGVVLFCGLHLVHREVGSPVAVGMDGLQGEQLGPVAVGMDGLQGEQLVGGTAEGGIRRAVQSVPGVMDLVNLVLFNAVAEVGEAQVLSFIGMEEERGVRGGHQHAAAPCEAVGGGQQAAESHCRAHHVISHSLSFFW